MLLLLLLSCTPAPGPDSGPWTDWLPPEGTWSWEGDARVLVTEADSTMDLGTYGVLDPARGAWIADGNLAHADATGACAGPWLVVVNRFLADNLQFVDPETGATVAQWSTGNGTNPHGVVFRGQEAWIALYETDYLLVARWDTGEEVARVDLSPWADADGIPEADALFEADGLLWVALQRMDRETWAPAGGSTLVGVDPDTRTVVAELPLPFENPTGGWQIDGTRALSAAIGDYEAGGSIALDGGLAWADLEARTTQALLSEADLGRNLYAALVRDDLAWLSTYDAQFQNRVEIWRGPEWALESEVLSGYYADWDLASDGSVWLADNSAAMLRLLEWDTGREVDAWTAALKPTGVTVCEPPTPPGR